MSSGERAALFETEQRGLHARYLPARGSPVLAVVFSQVRVPEGHFGLSRLFGKTSHAVLLINQPANDWYRGCETAIDAAIEQALAVLKSDRIVLYGSSMGAFGALATAQRWPQAEAVVFAPDLQVGEPASRSTAAGLRPVTGEADLGDLLDYRRQGRLDIVFGMHDPYDAGVAARLTSRLSNEQIRLIPLASSHEVHDHLYMLNVIRRVMSTFTRDIAAEASAKGLLIDRPDWEVAGRLGIEAAKPAPERDPEFLRILASEPNCGAALLLSDYLESRDDLVGAEHVLAELDAAIAASPLLSNLPMRYRKQIPIRRLGLLERLGKDGSTVRKAAAENFPGDPQFRATSPAVERDP